MKLKKWKISEIEEKIGKKLKRNTTTIGFDVAKKNTGIAVLITLSSTLYITKLHTINNAKGDLKKYDSIAGMTYFIGELNNFISNTKTKGYKIFIIEDCFFGKNANTLKILARFSALTWRELKHIADKIYFKLATTARSQVGFKKDKNSKKKSKIQVKDFVNNLFGLTLKDDNQTDAIVLALSGLIRRDDETET